MEFYPTRKLKINPFQQIVNYIFLIFIVYLLIVRPWLDYIRLQTFDNLRAAAVTTVLMLIILIPIFVLGYITNRVKRSKISIIGDDLVVLSRPLGSDWKEVKTIKLKTVRAITYSYSEEQPFEILKSIPSRSPGAHEVSLHLAFTTNDNQIEKVWLPFWNNLSIKSVLDKISTNYPSIVVRNPMVRNPTG